MVPPPQSPPPSAQSNSQILQFLSSALSQRGPSALPYNEDVKWLIRQHLVSLIDAYPSLLPKTGIFTHNDGRSVNLLQSEGTVPMFFLNVTYNIPIIIWLVESYPRHPPLVYVNPTRDMVIKRPHSFVNPSGGVSIPYLQNWVYPSSNLVELARNLSHFFARDPPLYSQRRQSTNFNPSPGPNPGHSITSSDNSSEGVGSSSGYGMGPRPAIPPRTMPAYPPSPYSSGGSSVGRIMDDPSEVYRRNAINKLVENVHSDILGLRKAGEADMEGLFILQGLLRQREEELGKGLKEMLDEKEVLEQELQSVLMNTDVLEGWLRENEGKLGNLGGVKIVDADQVFGQVDVLSKQMMDCTASDLAIEDAIYALDKAVQEGGIPSDQYLKNVRSLSREQFFHRATASKVRAVQMQAQVASMASRPSPYAP